MNIKIRVTNINELNVGCSFYCTLHEDIKYISDSFYQYFHCHLNKALEQKIHNMISKHNIENDDKRCIELYIE